MLLLTATQVLASHGDKNEDELSSLDMSPSDLEKLCRKVIEGTILKKPAMYKKITEGTSKSVTFYLKAPQPAGADPVRVKAYCTGKKFKCWCTIVFILSSEMTETTTSGDLALDILGGGQAVRGGLLYRHFEEA